MQWLLQYISQTVENFRLIGFQGFPALRRHFVFERMPNGKSTLMPAVSLGKMIESNTMGPLLTGSKTRQIILITYSNLQTHVADGFGGCSNTRRLVSYESNPF
jgi:hypothetical protein